MFSKKPIFNLKWENVEKRSQNVRLDTAKLYEYTH